MAPLTWSNPAEVTVIRKINEAITVLSAPFLRFGHIKVGGRGTLVRLQGGGVAVFSPVALTDEVKAVVSGMGELKYIAALDIEHHIFLGPWSAAYPNAKVIAPEGLKEKREKQKNEVVPFHLILTKENQSTGTVDAEFDAEFDIEYVASHQNKEVVFFHKPTKTLIQADLLFNLPAVEQFSKTGLNATDGFLTKLFVALNGTSGKALGQQRLIWYAISSGDRTGFGKSIQRIAKWDFDRIIPCHGEVIETDGKSIFNKVFAWFLTGQSDKKTA